ncbi:MAG: TniB family NTP-binding protein [Chloroflexota bacterium]
MIDTHLNKLPNLDVPTLKFRTVPHTKYEETVKDIMFCVRATKKFGEPHCVPIEGGTRYGKTRMAEQLVVNNPPYMKNSKPIIPIWLVRVPSKSTPLQLVQYMLLCLGENPDHITANQPDMIATLAERIKQYVRDFVVLDDIHYLLNVNTEKGRQEIAQVLADVIKRSKTTFVILGIPDTIGKVLSEDPQLRSLFRTLIELESLELEINPHHTNQQSPRYKEQLKKFAEFIAKAELTIGIKLSSFSDTTEYQELLRRVKYVTDGVVGHIMNLFMFAEGIAYERRGEATDLDGKKLIVNLDILSEAYDKKFKAYAGEAHDTEYLLGRKNPFTIPLNQVFEID